MKARKLTEAGVERIRPDSERIEYPDLTVQGLRLIVQPSGRKSWAVRTRLRDGKSIKYTIGPYPAFKLAEARSSAREVLQAAERGKDPRAVRRAVEADTVEAVVADWLLRDQSGNRGYDKVVRIFDGEVLPRWRGRLITEIARRDCLDLIDRIADRGAVTYARRVHAHLHRMFRWAVGRGVIEMNPMADLPKPGNEKPRDRVLDDRELHEVWQAAGELGWPFGPTVRLLILTGARQAEIGKLTWREVDTDGAVVRLTGERTKTGDPRTIPLSIAALEIIEGLPHLKSSTDYVFTTTGRTPVSGWSRAKDRLDRAIVEARRKAAVELGDDPDEIKSIEDWRIHDLRRTVGTGLQRLGLRLEVIEAVLGHVSGSRAGIVGVYQRYSFNDEKRDALDAWAEFLAVLIEGDGAANVVPMRA